MEIVYCVVQRESLSKTDYVSSSNGRVMYHAVSHLFLTEEARVRFKLSACEIYVKVKAVPYRPGHAMRVPGG
jgi:hypothetical protein